MIIIFLIIMTIIVFILYNRFFIYNNTSNKKKGGIAKHCSEGSFICNICSMCVYESDIVYICGNIDHVVCI